MKGRAVAEDGRIVSRVDRACRGPGNRVHDRARQQVDRGAGLPSPQASTARLASLGNVGVPDNRRAAPRAALHEADDVG
jgi:hypothetical protein